MNKSWIKFQGGCLDGCCELCGKCEEEENKNDNETNYRNY